MSKIATQARNDIPERQNSEDLLKLLKARSQTYRVARRFQIAQLVATVALPIIGALASLWLPEWRAAFAGTGLALAGLDAFWLDRAMKRKLKEAAKISEQFDCELLDMPWNSFLAGKRVDPQIVGTAATAWSEGTSKLENWYSPHVAGVRLDEARLICQRSNLVYDSKLRRIYGWILLSFLIIVCFIIGITLRIHSSVWSEVLTGVMLPLAPFIIWSVREFFRQKDAATGIDQVKDAADSLFDKILLNPEPAEKLSGLSREFQDAILLRRSQNPLIAPKMYDLLRNQMEIEMRTAVEEIVRRLNQPRQGVNRGFGKAEDATVPAASPPANG